MWGNVLYYRKITGGLKIMPIKFDDKKLYSIRDLEKILPITPLTIRKYIREGKIKGHKIGKNWYVIKEDLEVFLGGRG
jgi:excisionase family DNA binding protein